MEDSVFNSRRLATWPQTCCLYLIPTGSLSNSLEKLSCVLFERTQSLLFLTVQASSVTLDLGARTGFDVGILSGASREQVIYL